MKPLPKFKLI